jgi:hypothetical protein
MATRQQSLLIPRRPRWFARRCTRLLGAPQAPQQRAAALGVARLPQAAARERPSLPA